MICSRGVLSSRQCSRKICLAVEIKIEWNLPRLSLKIPPIYLDASFPPDWVSQHSWNALHYFLVSLHVYTVPCSGPTRQWVTFTKCFIRCQAIVLLCHRYHVVSHHSFSNHPYEPVSEFLLHCLHLSFFIHVSRNIVSLSGGGSCLSILYHVPLIQLALYKCTQSVLAQHLKALPDFPHHV